MCLSRQLVFLTLIGTVSLLHAQVNTGTVTGTVTDSSGAAIPNVKVSVVQTETNFESHAVTNSEGLYRVQSLQPGAQLVALEAVRLLRRVEENLGGVG